MGFENKLPTIVTKKKNYLNVKLSYLILEENLHGVSKIYFFTNLSCKLMLYNQYYVYILNLPFLFSY